tara:strand:+ start:290 stop:685 length:396 start_codon:yes stop_codon:yes gene_type:complete
MKFPTSASQLINKTRLGMRGAAGYAASTVVLQTAFKVLDMAIGNRIPQVNAVRSQLLVRAMPGLGNVTVQDAVTLIPAGHALLKKEFVNAGAAYGAKIAMRSIGYNPLPDKNEPNQRKVKMLSHQLPNGGV